MSKQEKEPFGTMPDDRNSLPTKRDEPRGSLQRRDMLKTMTVVSAAALVSISTGPATPSQAAPLPPPTAMAAAADVAGAYKRKVVDEHEWKTIRILCDWIIPADDRSGSATDAGVPEFIDDWLEFEGGQLLSMIRGGLIWLDLECNR